MVNLTGQKKQNAFKLTGQKGLCENLAKKTPPKTRVLGGVLQFIDENISIMRC